MAVEYPGSEQTRDFLVLTDPGCQDPLRAGGKAARLARARAAGLPVLPGLVVPASASTAALRRALADVDSLGSHGAQLRVMETALPHLAALPAAAATLGDRLVVRSSSPLEGSTTWMGAFTSVLDVAPDAVLTAVRGVWASALGRDARERGEHQGVDPTGQGLAVLVQPQVDMEFGGTAEVTREGDVTVVAVAGSPAKLLSGWEPGVTARCDGSGGSTGPAVELLGADILDRVAELARSVLETCHDGLVEWACRNGQVILLQSTTGDGDAAGTPAQHLPASDLPDNAVAVAHAVTRYAGATGEALVLPWLVAGAAPGDRLPMGKNARRTEPVDPLDAWHEARRLGLRLVASVRCGSEDTTPPAWLRSLRGDDVERALHALARLRPVERSEAVRLGDLLDQVAGQLVASGALATADEMWSLTPEEIESVLSDPRAARPCVARHRRRAVLRWEAFCHAVVMACGSRLTGEAASPGVGAGPVVHLRAGAGPVRLAPRAVVVAARPLPHLAPLLWEASALVTFGGSRAAHLAEVARSLNVPAVVGCPAAEAALRDVDGPHLAAVDGSRGVVAFSADRAARS